MNTITYYCRYSGTSSQHRMAFSSHSPPASRYSQRSRAISPPPSPTPVSRRRKPSISPPARYKREFFNDAAEASSSDDCEVSVSEILIPKIKVCKCLYII